MLKIKAHFDTDMVFIECPFHNSEWRICSITKKDCGKFIDKYETGDYTVLRGENCPAVKGVTVTWDGDVKGDAGV